MIMLILCWNMFWFLPVLYINFSVKCLKGLRALMAILAPSEAKNWKVLFTNLFWVVY